MRIRKQERSDQTIGDRTAAEAIGVAKEFSQLAADAIKLATDNMELARYSTPAVLSSEELKEAAERFPNWEISYGFSQGNATKSFTRRLPDLDPSIKCYTDAGLSLSDPEHFDPDLLDIFGTYSAIGDIGTFPSFTIGVETLEPVTLFDLDAIEKADEFLLRRGYVVPMAQPEAESVAS